MGSLTWDSCRNFICERSWSNVLWPSMEKDPMMLGRRKYGKGLSSLAGSVVNATAGFIDWKRFASGDPSPSPTPDRFMSHRKGTSKDSKEALFPNFSSDYGRLTVFNYPSYILESLNCFFKILSITMLSKQAEQWVHTVSPFSNRTFFKPFKPEKMLAHCSFMPWMTMHSQNEAKRDWVANCSSIKYSDE